MSPVALVTGAARGIGAATVRRLAAAGWVVVAVDRCADDPTLPYALASKQDLDTVVRGAGDQVVGVHADARDPEMMAGAVDEAEQRFGGVDAVVGVAGVIAGGVPLWEMPPEQVRTVVDTDLGAQLVLARVGVPALLRRPQPRRGQ